MRIRTITGLAVAGVASAAALAVAGVSYAADDHEPDAESIVVRIVTDDCPERDGAGEAGAERGLPGKAL